MKTFLFTILCVFSVQAFAQRGGHGDKGFKILDELNLSKDQLVKIEQFKVDHKAKRKALKANKKDFREQMKQLFLDGKSDSELQSLHDTIVADKQKMEQLRLDKMIFLKNTLTEDQRKIYTEKRHKRKGKGMKKRKKRR